VQLIQKVIFLGVLLVGAISCSDSNQQPDPDFIPKNTKTTFSQLNSPIVLIDEAHHNLHSINGRFRPFTQVLESDGYIVKPNRKKFTLENLKQADILVIVNALDSNRRDYNPPYGDAFEDDEVEAVKQWVTQGGALFLVADHAPFPKVIEKLSSSFGFEFGNGHVNDAIFRFDNNGIKNHVIIDKTTHSKRITQVKTFGGSAFKIPEAAKLLLVLDKDTISLVPDIPFQINAKTQRVPVEGWSQGATLEFGSGRVAVFSEAMMFTSQHIVSTNEKRGLVSVGAEQNERFLLNVMHWLSQLI